jgi:hypothetical protein
MPTMPTIANPTSNPTDTPVTSLDSASTPGCWQRYNAYNAYHAYNAYNPYNAYNACDAYGHGIFLYLIALSEDPGFN